MALFWSLGVIRAAMAHDVPPSIVSLDIGRQSIDVELQLQLSELGNALSLPLSSNQDRVVRNYGGLIEQYVQAHMQLRGRDGRPFSLSFDPFGWRHTDNSAWNSNDWLVVRARFDAPAEVSTETFGLDYSVIVHRVVSHDALIYVRRDLRHGLIGDRPELVGMMSFGKTHLEVDGSGGSWWQGFRHMFTLGLHHIAEGTDHLLFLLTLLLPAPLLCQRGRWTVRRSGRNSVASIVRVVSGFTVGHSLTLALVAEGWLSPNTRIVEVLIAVSILVSSIHAWRPLFPDREGWLACGFGLVHGMAFAEVLSGLNFDSFTLVLSLLAFNLGIEAMQLVCVMIALPVLLLLSQTRRYGIVRRVVAGFSAACAAGWILERAFRLPNPLEPLLSRLAPPPPPLVIAFCLASMICLSMQLGQRLKEVGRAQNGSDFKSGATHILRAVAENNKAFDQ